ncbi:MAG: ABC transporter ATP-binding protein [Halieaceae bacterium]|jgi:ABC-2 type transport system ATP-binding protein|nr:ABC transporter ATP-binding protein [Halieaceae bacterium]
MINVKNLARAYGDFLAVDGVSFDIPDGEIVGLLGHNGAGKTTIMKMLSGYLEPSAGSIVIDDIDLAEDPGAVQARLGYLPENLPVYPDMTVADYLDYAAVLKGLEGEGLQQAIRRAVRDTELQGKLLDPINTLSRGYRQRVGVAQALLGSPRVLILDEPTNGLDPTQTQHMRELIQTLAQQATVILSTHIMQEVDAICDRVLILNAGKLVVDQRLDALRNIGNLLLKTNLSVTRLRELLPELMFSEYPDGLRVSLANAAEGDAVAAQIARTVNDAGGELYLLAPERRDLEAVFREVSQDSSRDTSVEGRQHAA